MRSKSGTIGRRRAASSRSWAINTSPLSGVGVGSGFESGTSDFILRSATGQGQLDRLKRATVKRGEGVAEDKRLLDAAHDFESVFVNQLLKLMRQTVEKSGLISGGQAEEIFQGMLDEKYADIISQDSRLGLADMIYKELKKKP